MKDGKYDAMAEATRLTREGKLAEAAALIQRSLGGTPIPPQRPGPTAPAQAVPPSITAAESKLGRLRPVVGRAFAASAPENPKPSAAAPRRPGVRTRRPVPADAVAPAGGRWIAAVHTSPAGTRGYKLFVPSGYHGQPVPLLVMLHGCTQDPDDFAAGTGMNARAEGQGFLVAYPEQAASANQSKCWNWFQTTDQKRGQGEPALIAGITRQVMDEYRIEARRVYIAGMSAGGAMAAIMAVTYPDVYAAVGVHSGLAPHSAHDLSSAFQAMQGKGKGKGQGPASARRARIDHAIPLILFQGDSDQTVHPSNADHLVEQWAAAAAFSTGGTAPTALLRRGQTAAGRDYTCAIYHDVHGRAVIEQWTLHGAGHAWSGGTQNGSYTDPAGPDASGELIRFFQAHPRGTAVRPPA